MIALGVDPGKDDGAAVWLRVMEPGVFDLLGWADWRKCGRGAVSRVNGKERRQVDHYAAIRAAMWGYHEPAHVLTVEGQDYQQRGQTRSPATMVTLARASGVAIGAAHIDEATRILVPLCTEWRAKVLRLSIQSSGPDAKAAAIRAVKGRHAGRIALEWTLRGGEEVPWSSHLAEAACLAVYGALEAVE